MPGTRLLEHPAAAASIVAVMSQLVACTVHTTKSVPLGQLSPEERSWLDVGSARVSGVSTYSGITLAFDSVPLPRQVADTVFASVGGGQHAVPRALIAKVWVTRPGHGPVSVGTSDIAAALGRASFGSERIAGVTTRAGAEVRFDRRAPVYVVGDTLFASAGGAPYRIELAQVQQVSVARPDRAMSLIGSVMVTMGVLGVLAGAVVVALATGPGIA